MHTYSAGGMHNHAMYTDCIIEDMTVWLGANYPFYTIRYDCLAGANYPFYQMSSMVVSIQPKHISVPSIR